MGNTKSSVTAESIANQFLDVMASATATSSNTFQVANVARFDGSCHFTGTIYQGIAIKVNATILQTVSSSDDVVNDMQQTIEQISKAEAPNLNLNPGSVESDAFTVLITSLSTAIRSSVGAQCTEAATGVNSVTCTGEAEVDTYIQQDLVLDFLYMCTQNVMSVVTAKQDLQTFIDQHSSATTKDVITGILIAIAVIIALVIVLIMVYEYATGPVSI